MNKITKNIWSIACKRSVVDERSKLMSLIDVIEKLILDIDLSNAPEDIQKNYKNGKLTQPINIPGEITIASFWTVSENDKGGKLQLSTIVLDNENKELAKGELSFQIEKGKPNHRTFVTIPTFPISGSGTYTIRSILSNSEGEKLAIGETPIIVEVNSKKIN
jgi:hypothetical protein